MLRFFFLFVFYSLLSLNGLLASAGSHVPLVEWAPKFTLTPKWTLTLEKKFYYDLSFGKESCGKIYRTDDYMKIDFEYYDHQNQLQAKALMTEQSYSINLFKILDPDNEIIGYVKKKERFFGTDFELLSPREELLAEGTIDFWGTYCTLNDLQHKTELAVVYSPYFSFSPAWTLQRVNSTALKQNNIDDRVFTLFLSFLHETKTLFRKQQEANHAAMFFFMSQQHQINQGRKHLLSTTSNEGNPLIAMRNKLESFRPRFEGMDLLEKETNAVKKRVQKYLSHKKGSKQDCTLSKKIKGMNYLLPFLSNAKWSERERGALFNLLDHLLQELEQGTM